MPSVKVTVDDKAVKALFARLKARVNDLTPAMKVIGEILRTSSVKNFEAGGRPPWKPSKRAGQTLVDTARLRNSITAKAFPDRAEAGTNVKYAGVHQFGFKGTVSIPQHTRKVKSRNVYENREGKKKKTASGITIVKAHTTKMNIPARPFMMVQDEDITEAKDTLLRHIMEAENG